MSEEQKDFESVSYDEYRALQYDLDTRLTMDELETGLVVKTYGLYPTAQNDLERGVSFTTELEIINPYQLLQKSVGNVLVNLLVYTGELSPDDLPTYEWTAVVYPDLRPNSPRINGSPLADWAFPTDHPVDFPNRGNLRMGFLSRTVRISTINEIESFANQGKEQ